MPTSPLHRNRRGGHAVPDRAENHLVAGLKDFFRFDERQGNARAGGVADVLDVDPSRLFLGRLFRRRHDAKATDVVPLHETLAVAAEGRRPVP